MVDLFARIRAWLTGKPEPAADLDTSEITFEQTHDAAYWARRDSFLNARRPKEDHRGFGPPRWKL